MTAALERALAPEDRAGPLVPPRLRWAMLLVLVFHGGLLLFGSYQSTYDAYVHIFLADHYDRDWFSTWDQRWYTGFTTVSYPPGTHMAVAAVSKLTGDLELAYALVQLFSLELLVVGVYRFSRMWVDDEAAANASLLLAGSSAVAETVHVFGQLPTIWALAFLLNALPFMGRWVFEGRVTDLVSGTVTLAACTAGHHVTTLFGSVFFLGPVLAHGLLVRSRRPLDDERHATNPPVRARTAVPLLARRIRRAGPALVRTGILAAAIVATLVIVVLPYWWWSATDPITQIPIPHGSRENFLEDANIGLVFFLIPWGLMLLVLPYALVRGVLDGKWPLAASILLLFVLGTGGTTPVPRVLLGQAFDVLTLDRFTFWATMLVLPLGGMFVRSLEKGSINAWLRATGGPMLARAAMTGFVVGIAVMALFSATLAQHRTFQPQRIDPDPIVAFIEKDQHERWRFLTLGFGDQVAWLSAQTDATQVDGNYHSVRRLPELTSTSVERLEGAKYRGISGLGSLQQFLEVPEKYNLKFVFSNDEFYDPLLHFVGWQRLGPLENGIVVWERADIPPLPAELPSREVPPWQRLMWGLVPPGAVLAALAMLSWNLAGRPGSPRSFSPRTADRRIIVGPLQWLDRLLWRIADTLPDTGLPRSPDRLRARLLDRLQTTARRRPSRRRRALRLALIAACLLVVPLRSWSATQGSPDPTDQVEAYFDDLDYRRWTDAYDRLDPQTSPDRELWRLQRSVEGGVLASYAKLDGIETELVSADADRAVVRASLRYLTAIDWYPIEREVVLHNRGGTWFIEPDETELTIPPDQLVRRADVDYVIQGRRRVTSGTTELTDVQDRPELYVRSADLVEIDGLPVLVGEVVNLDVDPGDLTLTGVLRNGDGDIIARYNATEHVIRTVRPRESTPFRIMFEEVAAGTDLDFDPLDFTPVQLDEAVAAAEVYAKGVVTTGGLSRGLGVNDVRFVETAAGMTLEGSLRNDGVDEAVIPRILVSFLDADDRVLWTQNHYLSTSIRSQRSGEFTIELDDLSTLRIDDLAVDVFHNGIVPAEGALAPARRLIPAPDGLPYDAIRLDLSAFLGVGP